MGSQGSDPKLEINVCNFKGHKSVLQAQNYHIPMPTTAQRTQNLFLR